MERHKVGAHGLYGANHAGAACRACIEFERTRFHRQLFGFLGGTGKLGPSNTDRNYPLTHQQIESR
jgi:hypothetical protein